MKRTLIWALVVGLSLVWACEGSRLLLRPAAAQAPEARLIDLAWSPDGSQIAGARSDGTLQTWSASTGQPLVTFIGHTDGATAVAWSPDGSRLASGSWDTTIKIWNTANGELYTTLDGPGDVITGVAWTPDGSKIIGAGLDTGLRIWDATTFQLLDEFLGEAYSIALSPAGDRIATAQTAGVGIRDLDSGTGPLLKGHEGEVLSVDWSPDGSKVVSGGVDGTVRTWDAITDQPLLVLRGHTNFVETVAWSPDGSMIASGSYDGTTRLWNATTGASLAVLPTNSTLVAWSPDGSKLAHGAPNGGVGVVDVASVLGPATPHSSSYSISLLSTCCRTVEAQPYNDTAIFAVAWSPSGDRVATGVEGGSVQIRDAQTGQILHTVQAYPHYVSALAWRPDGSQLASGGYDGFVKLWDATSGQLVNTLDHGETITALYWNSSGDWLVSCSVGANTGITLKEWDADTGELLQVSSAGAYLAVAESPDGTEVAMQNFDGVTAIWNTEPFELSFEFGSMVSSHPDFTYAVAWSPDGSRIATGAENGKVRIWDLASRQILFELQGNDNPVVAWDTSSIVSIRFSSDGTRLTSVSADGTLRTWNADTGLLIDTSQLAGAPIYAAAFSSDGTRLAYGGEGGTLEIIHTPPSPATPTLTPGAEPGRMSRIDTVQGLSNNSPRTTSGPSIRDAPNLPRRWLALPGQVRRYVRRGWRIPPERVC